MNYSAIKSTDIANGPGVRVSLFVSGCRNYCKGCFNSETWDFTHGAPYTDSIENYIIEKLQPDYIDGLSILGGDPFEEENQPAVASLCLHVRSCLPRKTIWCYTGYIYEDLASGRRKNTDSTHIILSNIDVLVDGPFIEDKKNIMLQFRGSSNQRILHFKDGQLC